MKKFIVCLTLLLTLFSAKESKAIVGAAAESQELALLGVVLMDVSTITVVERRPIHYRRGFGSFAYTTYRVLLFPALLVAGLVILDDEGRIEISGEMSEGLIAKAELSNDEVIAIEDNAEEINAIIETVASEVEAFEGTKEEKANFAASVWSSYADAVDVSALTGMRKILNLK